MASTLDDVIRGLAGKAGAVAAACIGVLGAGGAFASIAAAGTGVAGEAKFEFAAFAPGTGPFDGMNTRPVGDMTGDGIGEIAVAAGARFAPDSQDSVWVKRGDTSGQGTAVATTAFRVVAPGDLSEAAIAGISDLNDDGLAELAVSVLNDRFQYDLFVVFGRDDGATVDLASLGNAGFRITGASATANENLIGPGDLDGDGQGDVAFSSYRKAQIFFPPDDPAGQTFDAAAGGTSFETLSTADSDVTPALGAPGNLDSDGADELVVVVGGGAGGATTGAGGLAAAVLDFDPGDSSAVDDIAAARRGSVYRWPTSYGARVVGDVNGDGLRDLSVSSGGSTFLAFLGGRGIDRDVSDPQPGEGKLLDSAGRQLTDVGDVDGDGSDDVIDPQFMWLTGFQDMGVPDARWDPRYNRFIHTGIEPVEAIPDETGDGLPELLTSREQRNADRVVTGWTVQRFNSLALAPIELAKPAVDDSGEYVQVILRGIVRITPALRARLTDPSPTPVVTAENRGSAYGGSFDKATGRIEVAIPAELLASREDQGKTVRFQVSIENGNVPVAITQPQSMLIDFDPGDGFFNQIFGGVEDDTLPGTPAPDEIDGLAGDDELLGRGESDRLLGRQGDDRLLGAGGGDTLIGGRGRDVLTGGPGDDSLQCGKGRDQARGVGPGDETQGCERINRKGD